MMRNACWAVWIGLDVRSPLSMGDTLGPGSCRFPASSTWNIRHLGVALGLTQRFHHLRIAMVEEAAHLRIQCDDRRHLFGAQFKVEDVEVFDDALRPH